MLMLIWGVELKNDRLAIIGIHIIKIIRPHDRFMLLYSLTTKLLRGIFVSLRPSVSPSVSPTPVSAL